MISFGPLSSIFTSKSLDSNILLMSGIGSSLSSERILVNGLTPLTSNL